MCALLLAAVCAATLAAAAHSSWPTVRGPASVFGNDPVIGFHDGWDSGTTASGRPTSGGGVAINNPRLGWRESWNRYGGGWWWICPPRYLRLRCALLRQTDAGPVSRVVDVTAVAARHAWRILAFQFPTDSIWTARYRGHRKPRRP